jgi:hypothetical protein
MNEQALVVLVGGPMHGTRTLEPCPRERMTLESCRGDPIEYVCRLTRKRLVDGRVTPIALYAPESITDMEFDVLAADAIRAPDSRH